MKRKRSKAPVGATLVVLSSIFYASYGIWTKLTGNFFGAFTATALRAVVVLVILVPLTLLLHKFEPVDWRRNGLPLLGMLVPSFVVWGMLYFAVLHAGVGLTLTVNYASIVVGMFVLGRLFLGERFTKDKLLATVLGILGLACIFVPNSSHLVLMGLAAAVVSGFGSAMFTVSVKQLTYHATQATIAAWGTSLIGNIIMLLLLREPRPALTPALPWLYVLCFGLASLAASWLLIRGLQYIEAGAAGVLGLLEVVFGVLFGAVLFGERPRLLVLVGVILVIIAAAIPYLQEYRKV